MYFVFLLVMTGRILGKLGKFVSLVEISENLKCFTNGSPNEKRVS